jgi:hypothetical protein
VFVHEDDIKTHDNSLTLPNIFYLFKQDKLVSVLTCSMHMHCRPIYGYLHLENTKDQRKTHRVVI